MVPVWCCSLDTGYSTNILYSFLQLISNACVVCTFIFNSLLTFTNPGIHQPHTVLMNSQRRVMSQKPNVTDCITSVSKNDGSVTNNRNNSIRYSTSSAVVPTVWPSCHHMLQDHTLYQCSSFETSNRFGSIRLATLKQSKAKQRCVMGVGLCLYAQLVQTKNKQCKSEIILQCYHPHLCDFCSRPRLTQPYNHVIYPGVAKIYLVFLWKCLTPVTPLTHWRICQNIQESMILKSVGVCALASAMYETRA